METLQTILKGKLTEGSLVSIILALTNLQNQLLPVFNESANSAASWSVIIVATLGSIWGKLRRKTEAYKTAK